MASEESASILPVDITPRSLVETLQRFFIIPHNNSNIDLIHRTYNGGEGGGW